MDLLTKISEALRSLGLLHSDIDKISSQIESATAEYKANNEKDKPAPVVNAVMARSQAEIDEENAREGRHETRAARTEWRDNKRLQVETAALILGGILAVATIGQWIVTKEAVRVAARSAAASERSAAASESQARTTQESVQSTVDVFRLEQRAWVVVNSIVLTTLKVDEPLRIDGDIVNTGKTPAFNIRLANTGIQTNYGPLDIEEFIASGKLKKPIKPPSTAVAGPNSSFKIPFSTDQNMTDTWVADIGSHKMWVYVFGDIYYRDAFGAEHLTEFCGSYDPPTRRFDNCPKHIRAN